MMRKIVLAAAVTAIMAAAPALAQEPRKHNPPAQPAKPRPSAPIAPLAVAPAPVQVDKVVYITEGLRTGPMPASLLERLKPLHTLLEVELMLKANEQPFFWRKADLDMTQVPPEMATTLASVPHGEPFILPLPDGGFTIAAILGKR